MHKIVNNLILINKELSAINSDINIIAVSKTFPIEHIQPAIDYGHLHFGENKVQEALEKWTEIKEKNKSIKLHLIGKLQTNKVKFCLPLFDFIHSLDNIKLADKIANEQVKKILNQNCLFKSILEMRIRKMVLFYLNLNRFIKKLKILN